jgi:hypothetical protein
LKRLSNNRDLFEAPAQEQITVTVEASKVPYQVTFSVLESGGTWTQVQNPTAQTPVEIRSFKMPSVSREFFDITYSFPPAASTDADAKYKVTISGGGTTDGPNSVLPPPAGSTVDLPYEFRLPAASTESVAAKPVAKKAAPKNTKGGGAK